MKLLIMGLGHLASFVVQELPEDAEVTGTFRTVSPPVGFENVRKILYTAGDSWPKEFFEEYDAILWNFPPLENYGALLEDAHSIFKTGIPWIFVSSTSVYGNGDLDETSPRTGTKFRKANLVLIENHLRTLKRPICILRPGGLVDDQRNPVHFLTKKTTIERAKTPINLVHTRDVARFISLVLKKRIFSEDFNLVSSQHPSKEEFYSTILKAHKKNLPKFLRAGSENRIIRNKKSRAMGFDYLYDDLTTEFSGVPEVQP